MRIQIAGINIDGLAGKYTLRPPVVGLDKPSIRTSDGDFSGRDGGYVSNQLYSKRLISITGQIRGDTCEDHELLRVNLQNALPIRELLPVFITTFGGRVYLAEGYVVSLNIDLAHRFTSDFKVDIVCPSPYLFDGGDGIDPDSGWITQPIQRVISGGYRTPYALPVKWSPGSSPSVVVNSGDVDIYPQIILDGAFTNPQITNVTTGQLVKLNTTTSADDQIVIDMSRRTVTLNGGSILPMRSSDSSWWWLQPGSNLINLETDSAFDAMGGSIRYRAMYGGI